MSFRSFVSRLPQDFFDEMYAGYCTWLATKNIRAQILSPEAQKASLSLLLELLSVARDNSGENKVLLEKVDSGDITEFTRLFVNNGKYKEALYRCAAL